MPNQTDGLAVFNRMKARIEAMYQRKPGSRLNYQEEAWLAEICRGADVEAEFEELEAFRRRTERRYFPNSLFSLLQHWNETLDRSRIPPEPSGKDRERSDAWLRRTLKELGRDE